MNQEMANEKAFGEIVKAIHHLIETKRGPSTLEQILRDYRLIKGKQVAYKKLGYKSEQDLLEASRQFSLKEKNGKIFIDIKKPKRKVLKSVKAKSATSIKTVKFEDLKDLIQSSEDLDKEGMLVIKKIDELKLNDKKPNKDKDKETEKNPIENELKAVRSKMKIKIVSTKKPLVTKISKSDVVLNYKSNEKIPSTKQHIQRQQLLNGKIKLDKAAEKTEAITDEDKVKPRSNYSTPLTRISTLSSPLMKGSDGAFNYLELHLVHILHTKVSCHPNGFDVNSLPEWYERTFDRPIENGWFDLIKRSRKFAQEKVNDSTILHALNDNEIASDIEETRSLDKEHSPAAIEEPKSPKLNDTDQTENSA
uniref:HTH OST-type domain-containing protein n=1 Tax=Glossina austeni TaxID=7395 RepID=A0A1A9VWS9_GLOAU